MDNFIIDEENRKATYKDIVLTNVTANYDYLKLDCNYRDLMEELRISDLADKSIIFFTNDTLNYFTTNFFDDKEVFIGRDNYYGSVKFIGIKNISSDLIWKKWSKDVFIEKFISIVNLKDDIDLDIKIEDSGWKKVLTLTCDTEFARDNSPKQQIEGKINS